MAALFSEKFDWFLQSLQPHSAPTGNLAFPAGFSQLDARIGGNETLGDMFVRCINGAGNGNVRCCQVEDDLAVFAFVSWRDGVRLSRANIQAIKTIGVDVQTYFANPVVHQSQYFRLDVDRYTGLMFTHPFPHVHYVPHREVRYSLNGWKSNNAVVDFFEHIYLQCYHPWWLAWAKGVWDRNWDQTGRPAMSNPFQTIVGAFRESQYPVLEQHAPDLKVLKDVLRRKKDDSYPLRVDATKCALLAYPCGV